MAAVKSEIIDPKNRQKVTNRLKNGEKEAPNTLVRLQNERLIVMKPCDKGAEIIIIHFDEYLKAAQDHLEAKTSTGENYYKELGNSVLKGKDNQYSERSI